MHLMIWNKLLQIHSLSSHRNQKTEACISGCYVETLNIMIEDSHKHADANGKFYVFFLKGLHVTLFIIYQSTQMLALEIVSGVRSACFCFLNNAYIR